MYNYSYITTAGTVKEINQDALMIKTARYRGGDILFAAVCNGIGGLSGGEDASSFVIKKVSDWFEKTYSCLRREEKNILEIRQSLDECLHMINDDINRCCTDEKRMGTTFTSLLIDPAIDAVLVAHVGDTRLYRIYDGRAEVVTADHSVVAEEVRRGIISEESAKTDKRQNQITNCIGAGETGRMYDFIISKPETECTYMLCSDGFRKMITDEEISASLSPLVNNDNDTINKNLTYLLDLNMQRDEDDNITALAVRYTKEGADT
jgi:protein phosphatase